MKNEEMFDVVVIGGGHAGLSASYCLKKNGLHHVVFEKGRIGESWRTQRWDFFRLNTANKLNVLPGVKHAWSSPDSFSTGHHFINLLEAYAAEFCLPVRENTLVKALEKDPHSGFFKTSVAQDGVERIYSSRTVVMATGDANEKKIPAFASVISSAVNQLHSSEYRNSAMLPDGAALVVGSGQSGCQIAEDLLAAGRRVYLSTSAVPRVPRRYRGQDIMDWLVDIRFMETKTSEVNDPLMLKMPAPLLSGLGDGGRTLSLQNLAREGAILIGSVRDADEGNVFLDTNAAYHVHFGDGFSEQIKRMIDRFIIETNRSAPPAEMDLADVADPTASCITSLDELNFKEHNLTTIIWATGFKTNCSYLKTAEMKGDGNIQHREGVVDESGIFLLGHHWLRSRKSGLIYGVSDDAEFIVKQIKQSLLKTEPEHKAEASQRLFKNVITVNLK